MANPDTVQVPKAEHAELMELVKKDREKRARSKARRDVRATILKANKSEFQRLMNEAGYATK